jgi:hypothetical protein
LAVLPAIYSALIEDCRTRGGLDIPRLLEDRDFALEFVRGAWRSQVEPDVRAAWQYAILLLFHALLIHALKARASLTTLPFTFRGIIMDNDYL